LYYNTYMYEFTLMLWRFVITKRHNINVNSYMYVL